VENRTRQSGTWEAAATVGSEPFLPSLAHAGLQCSKRALLPTISGALAGKSAAPGDGLLRLHSRLPPMHLALCPEVAPVL
jgi:hypothetical protein